MLNNFAKDADGAAAVILSVEGVTVSEAERALFKKYNPFGFILFARNIETPEQVKALADDLKAIVGRDCPILVDQEGGRVQRLKPPVWSGYAAAQTFGSLLESDGDSGVDRLQMRTKSLSKELRECGINVNCDPVLDVAMPETHEVIGDRAYSETPEIVGMAGMAVCQEYLKQGIAPIIKHLPGHGRATADSHLELPLVNASLDDLRAVDFVPFQRLAQSDIGCQVWAMSAHILYSAIDSDLPLTLSEAGIEDVIRQEIGFKGVLVSDDVSMKALDAYGDLAALCCASIQAGCDIALYCWAKMDEMQKISESVPKLSDKALERLQNAA